jgi:hypothetical protein
VPLPAGLRQQVANLYIGPLDFAPTPTPISMVDFQQPDLQRHPRFPLAMQAAQVTSAAAGWRRLHVLRQGSRRQHR